MVEFWEEAVVPLVVSRGEESIYFAGGCGDMLLWEGEKPS